MQGRPGQGNDSWDREKEREKLTAARMAAVRPTGQQRALPQRPAGMTHLNAPPDTPRVPRPQRQPQLTRKGRKGALILGGIFAVVAIIILIIVIVLVSAVNQSSGPASTATDFLSSLSSRNYQQAFQDLGPGVTLRMNQQQFTAQAQGADHAYGQITNYVEVPNSAKTLNNGTTESFTYTITRSQLKKTYQLHLTLQQDSEDQNAWRIIDYGTTLGPTN